MKSLQGITLEDVQEVYSGREGDLWELVMGEQIHIGGFASSMDLAEKAGICGGMNGLDLCCCNGAGMRFLVRFRKVDSMHGVDATEKVVERGRSRCQQERLGDRIKFSLADVCDSKLPSENFDFVWGEDAWCYVVDKERLISEAVRMAKPGGLVTFTDWIEGPTGMTNDESRRFMQFMKFPNVLDQDGYCEMLSRQGCKIILAQDTGRFAPYVDLYLDMLNKQLTYDALKVIDFDMSLMASLAGEMEFMQRLAHEGKIAQGLFVARK